MDPAKIERKNAREILIKDDQIFYGMLQLDKIKKCTENMDDFEIVKFRRIDYR